MTLKPKRIEVRPGNQLEGFGIVVWIYHRKCRIQVQYDLQHWSIEDAMQDALEAWEFGMENTK